MGARERTRARAGRGAGVVVLLTAALVGGVVGNGGSVPGPDGLAAAFSTVPAAAADDGADPCAGVPRAPFRDVGDTATAADAIDCLVWYELVRGVTHDRFAPSGTLTRAQAASLLDRLITAVAGRLPDPPAPRFDDVSGTHAGAIERLAAAGIIAGRTAERYEPDAPVRRDQLASLLIRTHDHLVGSAVEPATGAHPFLDVAGNAHEDAIAAAVGLGLVGGTTEQTYEPDRSASRAQTAMVLARLFRAVGGGGAWIAAVGGYDARIAPLPASLLAQVERWTWEPGCPVHPRDLRLIELVHTDLAGTDRWGQLVVHEDVTTEVAGAFGALYEDGFRVERMQPVEAFRGDDDASMAANNSSAFNCRRVTGGTSYSQHSFGRAIDINPIQNPYVRGTTVLPSAGRAYLDRTDVRPGMLVRPGGVDAFAAIGWGWGGDFRTLKDYQHLSASGG